MVKRLPVEEGCGEVKEAEDRMERARLLSRSMLSERVSEGPIGFCRRCGSVWVDVDVGDGKGDDETVQLENDGRVDALEPALMFIHRHNSGTSGLRIDL